MRIDLTGKTALPWVREGSGRHRSDRQLGARGPHPHRGRRALRVRAGRRVPALLQRLIEPDEIANMVAYLSSPLASATTGAAVRVDGGYIDSIVP